MAYNVKLPIFEGPLDLLLHLIKQEEMNICDIPIARITEQYLEYLHAMKELDLDVAGEFLVMAATLVYVKSQMLLPQEVRQKEVVEEPDPRADLVQRLLEYQRFKEAAAFFRQREGEQRCVFVRPSNLEAEMGSGDEGPYLEASLFDLIGAFSKALREMPPEAIYQLNPEEVSVEERVEWLSRMLTERPVMAFSELRRVMTTRWQVVSSFLAVLELIRQGRILVVQQEPFGEIEIQRNDERWTIGTSSV